MKLRTCKSGPGVVVLGILGLIAFSAGAADTSQDPPPRAISFEISLSTTSNVTATVVEGAVAELHTDDGILGIRPRVIDDGTGLVSLEYFMIGDASDASQMPQSLGASWVQVGFSTLLPGLSGKIEPTKIISLCRSGFAKGGLGASSGGCVLPNSGGSCCVPFSGGQICGCMVRVGGSSCCEPPCCPARV